MLYSTVNETETPFLKHTHCIFSPDPWFFPKVTITQTYKNEEQKTIEAIYKFPIHDAAAICKFEAEIDGNRKIKGIVKEAQQAAEDYDKAVEVHINEYY